MEKKLAYRMYFFVPYNISPIQQAIQAGHAALEYARKYFNDESFQSFVSYDKTWIILNGGTTNEGVIGMQGSLQGIRSLIMISDIPFSTFNEPDLNDALTAVCFLADERVWDYTNYPEFKDWFTQNYPETVQTASFAEKRVINDLRRMTSEEQKEAFPELFDKWVKEILGENKNLILRDLIRNKKTA